MKSTKFEDEESVSDSPVELNKGGLHSLKNKKKFLYGLAFCVPFILLVIQVIIYLKPSVPTGPPLPREEYARITKETYDKYYQGIANMDMKDSATVHRRLLQIHFPVGPNQFQRRSLIRTYQISPYTKKYDIDWKFIIGEPSPIYRKAIKAENDTYGDIIILPGYADSNQAGRTTKSPEYYKWLEKNTAAGQEFKFIGRIDSDCFINFDKLFSEKFTPEIQANDNFAVLTTWVLDLMDIPGAINNWPQGSFYIFSWKTMLMYNRFYTHVPRELECDDELMGRYLYDSQLQFTNVRLNNKQAYDLMGIDQWGTIFSPKDSIRVHWLKEEEKYVTIGTDLSNLAEHNLTDFNDEVKSVVNSTKIGEN